MASSEQVIDPADPHEANVKEEVSGEHPNDEQPAEVLDEQASPQAPTIKKELDISASIEHLQTEEQRRVLDTVAQVRKCGLDSILSLPQLVVCGDQSAGKSSVLEALTEIPFPRNDNLCTRFATEIILRRANTDTLTIKIIPDPQRPAAEQIKIKEFKESITDFDELPRIMDAAKAVMDEDEDPNSASKPKAFAKDILSIEIEGPKRPQLTLVDIPGLIHTDSKGVTKADVEMVTEITDQYISSSRTICLAVVSAAYDYSNQMILSKVRNASIDPDGDRTLGIITKPDLLPKGSGSEQSYLELANNGDIQLKLGWHVLKNRKFEEGNCSLLDRKSYEQTYFRTSNFGKQLPASSLGIDALRSRLSLLLFEHVKQELPQLRNDLEEALQSSQQQLDDLGERRTKSSECRDYIQQKNLDIYGICKAAVDGHYEGSYFAADSDQTFDLSSSAMIRRLRAVVQSVNTKFSDNHRKNGHKFQINISEDADDGEDDSPAAAKGSTTHIRPPKTISPVAMNRRQALKWVREALNRTRGREMAGTFNPLLVGELFWEQSSNWQRLAVNHLDDVSQMCEDFLDILLKDKYPEDIVPRIRISLVQDRLKERHDDAIQELGKIMEDVKSYPINYNHYYTDTLAKRRLERQEKSLEKCLEDATSHTRLPGCHSDHASASIDVKQVIANHSKATDPNMENVTSEEALDSLYSIYKVSCSPRACPAISDDWSLPGPIE